MKLGTYIGLHAAKPDLTVAEAEIDQVLNRQQKEHAFVYSIDDRPAAWGDEVIIDFSATLDGEPIPGGTAKGYRLILGAGRFIAGMEDSLIGRTPGDSYDVTLTFPDNYRSRELQGKQAVFHVVLHRIFQPEYQPIDDDFALDYSEYSSIADWKAAIRADLEARRQDSAVERLSRELLTQIIDTSDIPLDDAFIDQVAAELFDDFLDELEFNSIPLPLYCKRNQISEEQIQADKRQEAIEMISAQYVLHAIADVEAIEIDPAQLSDTIASMAADEGVDPEEYLDALDEDELDAITDELLMEATMEFIMDQAILD